MWEGLENLKNAMKKVEELEKRRFDEEIQKIQVRKGIGSDITWIR